MTTSPVTTAAPALAADSIPAPPKASTALPGVSLLPEPLDMPGLNRKRQVRLYLPPGYATSGKRYPVLYMHDGQNCFDRATSAYGSEWEIDETLTKLLREIDLSETALSTRKKGLV